MTTRILMPQVPAAAGAPNEIRWLVGEGARVAAGEAVAEVFCPQGCFAIWSVEGGRMVRLLAQGEGHYPAGRPLADMDLDSEPGQNPTRASHDTPEQPARTHIRATPRAVRLAAEAGLDLSTLTGSGPGGRVIASDVLGATRRADNRLRPPGADRASAATPAELAPQGSAVGISEARTLRPVPVTFTALCLADRLIAVRRDFIAGRRYAPTAETPPSITDFLLKAWALALAEVPGVNVVSRRGRIAVVNGVTLALMQPGAGGRFHWIVGADRSSPSDIAAQRRRAGSAFPASEAGEATSLVLVVDQPDIEVAGLGIPPGFSTALGLSAVSDRASVVNGRLSLAPALTATLSIDSALVDPSRALDALAILRSLIEDPQALLGR